jgi:hypothetical protein
MDESDSSLSAADACANPIRVTQKGAPKMSEKERALACAKSGQKYILVSAGAAIADGSSIKIVKLEPAAKK